MSCLDEVFGSDGRFAAAIPEYEIRPGQIEMARAVDAAIRMGKRLLVDAPTGVGKSVAYLVPAIRAAVEDGQRVVVATANIALQEQLHTKDLPALAELLPWPFRYALLKGTGNYLCNRELAGIDVSAGDVSVVKDWAARTSTGDLTEVEERISPRIRAKLSTSAEECAGRACKHADGCFLLRARQAADKAQVVVVNMHLFFADLALRRLWKKKVLPDYSVVVLDEGHQAAEVARSFFGEKMTEGALARISRFMLAVDPKRAERLSVIAGVFFDSLRIYANRDDCPPRLSTAPAEYDDLVISLREASRLLTDYSEQLDGDDPSRVKYAAASGRAEVLAGFTAAAMQQSDSSVAYFVELERTRDGQRAALCGLPIDVSKMLREWLFESPAVSSVIVCSATLATNGSFALTERELGAENSTKLEVDSPFDWARQAVLAVPPELPQPNDKSFPDAAAEALVQAIRAARGRTLCLFTSWKAVERSRDAVRVARLPYRVLVQGEAPRTSLVELFRQDESSVLLGTASLWEGVDVPGDACSCVVLDRLPFDSPDDPISDAVNERRKDAFRVWTLPRANRKLRQGVGRLIRSSRDRGAVVILDRRIVTKASYGPYFMRAFPEGMRVFKGPDWAERLAEFFAPMEARASMG